ncbi:hypothetical protein E2562_024196 [Oryza meyeriana var. granulata]|uniref:Uncharacterized protein n=1 Tax=Oryza meyeriana var. granulata TaxID=110450 RepID=A0A6G1C196_9ORYZ|nr:hypothetical protein E2562_024196 [Oryza meyeriana var. granulata]
MTGNQPRRGRLGGGVMARGSSERAAPTDPSGEICGEARVSDARILTWLELENVKLSGWQEDGACYCRLSALPHDQLGAINTVPYSS